MTTDDADRKELAMLLKASFAEEGWVYHPRSSHSIQGWIENERLGLAVSPTDYSDGTLWALTVKQGGVGLFLPKFIDAPIQSLIAGILRREREREKARQAALEQKEREKELERKRQVAALCAEMIQHLRSVVPPTAATVAP